MYEWYLISAAVLTKNMITISKAKNSPAILVEIDIPLTIMKAPNARNSKVQRIQGTLFSPPTL